MSLKAVLISLWSISLAFMIAVYVQHDVTSSSDVLIWLAITIVATAIIVGGTKWKESRVRKSTRK